MASDKIKYSQNIFTFCLEKYGTLQEISRLVLDNNLKYGQLIDQGEELVFTEDIGNEDIKDFYELNKQTPSNLVDNPFVFASLDYEDDNTMIFEDGEVFIYEEN